MTPSPTSVILWVTAFAGILLAGCRNQEAGVGSPPAPASQGMEGFYDPQVRESWTYAVRRDFPPGTEFGADEADLTVTLPDGAVRFAFERRRVCTGQFRPEGADREFTTFEIFEDGTRTEREIYDITAQGVVGRGWAPADVPLAEAVLLTPGLKIAVPGMRGGQSWIVANDDSGRTFNLEVIEVSEVTVPAGRFEAARLRFTANHDGHSTKRTVWFAENVGIVKEEVVHYDRDEVRVREHLELVNWVLPGRADQQGSGLQVEPATTRAPAAAPPDPDRPPEDAPADTATATLEEFIREMIGDPYDESCLPPLPATSGPPDEGAADDEGLYE